MKQKVKPAKKIAQPRKPAQFAIEMDAKGISFFLALGLGAALIVFYLGYTYGKATRDPNTVALQQPAQAMIEGKSKTDEVQKNLKIYNIREDSSAKIEALKKDSQKTLGDAERLIAETKAEPAPAKRQERKPVVKKADSFKPQWPDNAEKKKSSGGLFTYQILSTPDIERATSRVKLLKQRGFDAYRVAAKVNGKLYYRVRVGRGSRSDLRAIETRLKKVLSGDGKILLMRYGQ